MELIRRSVEVREWETIETSEEPKSDYLQSEKTI